MVLTASTPFFHKIDLSLYSFLYLLFFFDEKILIMTGPNVSSYGVMHDRIKNIFNVFCSYLSSSFIILEPIACKKFDRNFYFSRFCSFLYTCYRVSLRSGSNSFLVKNSDLVNLFSLCFICRYLDFVINFFCR